MKKLMQLTGFGSLVFSFLFVFPVSAATDAPSPTATASLSTESIKQGLSTLEKPKGWNVNPNQKVEFDKNLWTIETLSDGTEIYTLKTQALRKPSSVSVQKIVVLRDRDQLSSITQMIADRPHRERATSVLFFKNRLYAITKCFDLGDRLGRQCLSATEKTCPNPLATINDPELKQAEVRAVTTLLTIRGTDHQLQNLARFGTPSGLKDPLQTTRGKLSSEKHRDAAVHQIKDLCRAIASSGSTVSTR